MSQPLTKERFRTAFVAWTESIKEKLTGKTSASFDALAMQWGKHITNREDLNAVSKCFNWDAIMELHEQLKDEPK
jgi:hypothetical protein